MLADLAQLHRGRVLTRTVGLDRRFREDVDLLAVLLSASRDRLGREFAPALMETLSLLADYGPVAR